MEAWQLGPQSAHLTWPALYVNFQQAEAGLRQQSIPKRITPAQWLYTEVHDKSGVGRMHRKHQQQREYMEKRLRRALEQCHSSKEELKTLVLELIDAMRPGHREVRLAPVVCSWATLRARVACRTGPSSHCGAQPLFRPKPCIFMLKRRIIGLGVTHGLPSHSVS